MTLDLTSISVALIAAVSAILGIVLPLLINARFKDAAAAATLGAAVKNSLGKLGDTATGLVTTLHPTVTIPGVPASLQAPTQYVLDHAGTEAARFGITPVAIADKISAQIGLQTLAATVATLPVLDKPAAVVPPAKPTPLPITPPVPSVPRAPPAPLVPRPAA